jgi:hydrogenase maturation protease
LERRKEILILGLGSLLLRDEGVGVRVAERIMERALPPNVEVMDGGTMGLNLLYVIEGREKVVVVDAVKAGSPPGTMYRFTDKDISDKKGLLRSAHGVDFTDVLKTAQFLGTKPGEVVFIGVEPEDLSDGMELSPLIESRVPYIIDLVMKELAPKAG